MTTHLKPLPIFELLEQLQKSLDQEYQALLGTDMDLVLKIQKDKDILITKLQTIPRPEHALSDPIKEKISYALTKIKKQAQTNAQIALGRAELTAARVSFIVEQISPSYDASGKNTVKPSGGLFNSKT